MDRTISSPAAISTRREFYQGSVFFDLTDMLEHARHHNTLSGITRTSLQIIGHLIEQYGTETIRLIGWHPVRQAMFELSNDWCTAKYEYNRREFHDYSIWMVDVFLG